MFIIKRVADWEENNLKWYEKTYKVLKTKLLRNEFISFYEFRIKKILQVIFIYYIPITFFFILFFALVYYNIDGIASLNGDETISFLDCFYFSTITFFSIGYGDYISITNTAKLVDIIQSILSFILLTLYSGFIVPIFFTRRNDVTFDNQLFLWHNGEAFTISFPIINKGTMFYEMYAILSFTLNNIRGVEYRYSLIKVYTTWFERIWFCDFQISKEHADDEEYMAIYEALYIAISEQINKVRFPKLNLCIHGIDSQTRGAAYFIKEYYLKGIRILFADHSYQSCYIKNHTKYKKKDCYIGMEDEYFLYFFELLNELVFPNNEEMKKSVTGQFELENKHLNLHWQNYHKDFYVY